MNVPEQPENRVNEGGTSSEIDTPVTQPRSGDVRGFVYFISCGEHIKIGFSTRPMDRLRALQTSHPDELEILGTIKGTRSLETKLHKRFADTRARGEWFEANNALYDYIDHHTIERKGKIDPRLSPEARSTIGWLYRLRDAHGDETPVGNTCTNLIEQILAMPDYVRPEWATYESQTLPGLMKKQMVRLERLRAAAN